MHLPLPTAKILLMSVSDSYRGSGYDILESNTSNICRTLCRASIKMLCKRTYISLFQSTEKEGFVNSPLNPQCHCANPAKSEYTLNFMCWKPKGCTAFFCTRSSASFHGLCKSIISVCSSKLSQICWPSQRCARRWYSNIPQLHLL